MAGPPPTGLVRAVRVAEVCASGELRCSWIARPSIRAGELLVSVHSAAVNRSDVLSIKGATPITTFPRVPGRDFAGKAAVMAFCTDNVLYHDQGLGVTFDRDGLEALISASFVSSPDLTFQITSSQVSNEGVAAEAIMTGTPPAGPS